ncbi:PGF-CTERM sorting domain-containing protein [Halorarius halobius]|uniref:PGF-CTERM sorting domain-containing protein n=1 Tax=Halorarius halobius TaxID=2962671 RepID=UPI0020CFB9B0|nr:PGF-CTERM sorting domain-containing protein [Halorarius halobius]
MNWKPVVVCVLVLTTAPMVVGASEDEIAENCDYTGYNVEEQEQNYEADAVGVGGAINSPGDSDAIPFIAEDGDYFAITFFGDNIGDNEREMVIDIGVGPSATELVNMRSVPGRSGAYTIPDLTRNASFKVYSESDDQLCITIYEGGPFQGEYNWSYTISENNEHQWYPAEAEATPTPTLTDTPQPTETPQATDTPAETRTETTAPTSEPEETTGETAQPDPEDETPSDGSGPGVGVLGAVIALLLVAGGIRHRS